MVELTTVSRRRSRETSLLVISESCGMGDLLMVVKFAEGFVSGVVLRRVCMQHFV